MKNLLFLLFLSLVININSQVAINNDGILPDSSAMLDIQSTTKGILVPRMTSDQRTGIVGPAAGLLVFDSETNSFWFYSGNAWNNLSSSGEPGWLLTGNSTTDSSLNFIGTTDEQPLLFRVNNAWAGEIHPTSGNLFFGLGAGQANITGQANTATGEHSLFSNTNGIENTANGYQALFFNTGGNYNTGSGYKALYSNTTAFSNTAGGHQTLYSNTTGSSNTANGSLALYSNTAGSDNTAIGLGALMNNTGGNMNTAIGTSALTGNTGGYNNIAIGYSSGTHPNAGNIYNTVSIGNDGLLNGYQNQVIIGNVSTGFIGGVVSWSVVSDARIKNTILEDVKGLDFISQLRPVTYHISQKAITTITGNKETADFPGKYDGEKVKYSGFIAQEVEQAAKDAGYDFSGYGAPKNEWGLYTLSYEQFVVPLVKAVQELNAINRSQQLAIENLILQNDQLLLRIEKLENK